MDATPEDVDEDTPLAITEDERADFDEPADSLLTEAQVDAFLKTSLLQFDLVKKHSERLHERVAGMEKRSEDGGALAGLRTLMDAGRTAVEFGDVFGGSYIRSARTLGYNPAELEWVRDRMAEVAALTAFEPLRTSMAEGARESRAAIEAMRAQMEASGQEYSEEDLEESLRELDTMEQEAEQAPSGATARNLELLRRAKPNVTDEMWTALGLSAGSFGLVGFAGLADPNDQEAQQQLTELRSLYTDALENRVSQGMERE